MIDMTKIGPEILVQPHFVNYGKTRGGETMKI
jgi:hypothetical protein